MLLLRLPGRLAQLGERRLDKAEVTGSSPVSPIKRPAFAGLLSLWFETSSIRPSIGQGVSTDIIEAAETAERELVTPTP